MREVKTWMWNQPASHLVKLRRSCGQKWPKKQSESFLVPLKAGEAVDMKDELLKDLPLRQFKF